MLKMEILSKESLAKIEVLRRGEVPEGFQRPLKEWKVTQIVTSAKAGRMIPAVSLARIGDRLVVIDGQHRVEARKIHDFELAAYIKPRTIEDAVKDFIVCNSTASRVSLSLILDIDPSKFGEQIRSLAWKNNATVQQAYNLIIGISGRDKAKVGAVEKADWDLAHKILEDWSKDKRWTKHEQFYSRPGVLSVIGSLSKGNKTPDKLLAKIKAMKFEKGSPLAVRYGTSGTSQAAMKDLIARTLIKSN